MTQRVKATYRDGVLEPSESLDLEDGDVVTLSISVDGSAGDGDSGESASVGNVVGDSAPVGAESQRPTDVLGLLERIKRISDSVPDSEWEKLPKDGARNKKHYLYGHPKEDEK